MATPKETIAALLERLPDDCSFDDIAYHLALIAKIDGARVRGEREGYLSEEDVDKRLEKWLRD